MANEQSESQRNIPRESTPQKTEDLKESLDQISPTLLLHFIRRITDALETEAAKDDSTEKNEREIGDLKAQQDMAHWAFWMMIASFAQAFIGAVGVLAVGWSLYYTRKALSLNRESINLGNKSTAAAVEAARIARNTERPYIYAFNSELHGFAESVSNNDVFHIMKVHLDFKNIGSGVGFIKGYAIAHEICHHGMQGIKEPTIRDYFALMPLAYNGKWGGYCSAFQIDGTDREEMLKYQKALYVYGYIRYSDLFGIVRRTGFMFEYIPQKDEPKTSTFVMCPHSNWYDQEEDEKGDIDYPR